MDADALVRDYLTRLDRAATALPAGRRDELTAEVREHIETTLTKAGDRGEVTVRNVLERLGAPDEIVAAESGPAGSAAPAGPALSAPSGWTSGSAPPPGWAPAPSASRWGPVEIIALLLLSVGWLILPCIGSLLALVFVWASDRWSTREKVIATVVVLMLVALPLALFMGTSSGVSLTGPQSIPEPIHP